MARRPGEWKPSKRSILGQQAVERRRRVNGKLRIELLLTGWNGFVIEHDDFYQLVVTKAEAANRLTRALNAESEPIKVGEALSMTAPKAGPRAEECRKVMLAVLEPYALGANAALKANQLEGKPLNIRPYGARKGGSHV